LIEKKKRRKVKHVESDINAAAGRAIHIKVKDLDAAAYYSFIAGKRMNGSCINSTLNIFSFCQNYSLYKMSS